MSIQIEQIGHSSMDRHKSLSLSDRLESAHPSLSYPGRLMRLLVSCQFAPRQAPFVNGVARIIGAVELKGGLGNINAQ